MHNRVNGFTMVETCLVLFVICMMLFVFVFPSSQKEHSLSLAMYQIQSFLEKVQNQAVADGTTYSVVFQGSKIVSECDTLQLPQSISCEGSTLYFYPQYTSAPAATICCTQDATTHRLVVQLGRGRSEIRD